MVLQPEKERFFQGALWRAPFKSFSSQPADVMAFCGVSSSPLGASSNAHPLGFAFKRIPLRPPALDGNTEHRLTICDFKMLSIINPRIALTGKINNQHLNFLISLFNNLSKNTFQAHSFSRSVPVYTCQSKSNLMPCAKGKSLL